MWVSHIVFSCRVLEEPAGPGSETSTTDRATLGMAESEAISVEAFNALGLSDASLGLMRWVHEGRDIEISLALASGRTVVLIFEWVKGLKIEIHQRDGAMRPLAWDGTAGLLDGNRSRVILDFAHDGSITLECETIRWSAPRTSA